MRQQSDVSELHDWAADEAATLVGRFADARTQAIARDFDAVRKAFETAARSIDAALAASPQARDEIGTFVERLTTHVGLDAIRTQLQEREAENASLKATLTNARTDLDAARADLGAERVRAGSARTEAARMTGELERTLEELHREQAAVAAAQAVACTSLPLDELLTVFDALGEAETAPALLTTLVNGLARDFARVALFDVVGDRLVGAEQVGFDRGIDVSTIAIPLAVESLLTRAVSTGRLESLVVSLRREPGNSLPFGGTPACALAIPIVVQGVTLAVVYADDSSHVELATAAPPSRVKFAELLHQHALLVLVRIWFEQKSVAGLREFAARLVADLEYAYQVEAEAGRNRANCQQRLKDDVEAARKRYAERAAREDRRAAALLDEHLAAAANERKDAAFGQDLAAVLGTAAGRGLCANVVSMHR